MTLFRPFSQAPADPVFRTKPLAAAALALLLSLAVVWGCLASLGILSSTDLAHPAPRHKLLCYSTRRRSGAQAIVRSGVVAGSYSRFSSDLQDASSITQQQGRCRDAALGNGHDLRPEFEFADQAISGSRPDRQGLQKMLAAARAGRIHILYFESLSRLAREMVLSQTILKELVSLLRIRVVSTSEGLDSDRGGWEMLSTFRSWMHGEFLKQLREAVLRGQEDAVLNDFSVGDWGFGYRSEPIEGSEAGRRGRNAKQRMRVFLCEVDSIWVIRIFNWFATEGRTPAWIARELTRLNAPKDHRSTTTAWRACYVVRLLRNMKYIGIWPWGKKTNVTFEGRISQVDCPPEDIVQFVRERPWLRIVPDELFFKAQGMLDYNAAAVAEHRNEDGRIRGSTVDLQNPRHLLQGLIRCAACESTFKVGGGHGRYLKCDGYGTGICKVKTQLPRERAERMILDCVGDTILRSPEWTDYVYVFACASWETRRRNHPDDCADLERRLKAAESKISNILDAIERGSDGDGGRPDPDLQGRLQTRRKERDDLKRELASHRKSSAEVGTPPTREWVEEQLRNLHDTLISKTPAAAVALRELLGTIRVEEVPPARGKRLYLRGRFSIQSPALVPPGAATGADHDPARAELAIDFTDPPPWAAIANRVKELYDARMRFDDMTAKLGCSPSWPAKALAYWHEQRGSPVPDGRSERARLAPDAETLALRDRAKGLWDGDLLVHEIADRLGCCRDTVTALIRDWHTSRGLEVPSGTSRRATLTRKSSKVPLESDTGVQPSPAALAEGAEATPPMEGGGTIPIASGNDVADSPPSST